METREARVKWLKEQAAELGLNVVKGPRLDVSMFDAKAFEKIFQDYADADVRVTAILLHGKLTSIRLTRVLKESKESRARRSDAAKARWALRNRQIALVEKAKQG